MNAKYINPILESTLTVLSTMAMVDAKPGTPSIKQGNNNLGEVTGQIDLAGKDTNGSLAISFSEPAILDIVQKMLGETLDSIDETVVDAVGELTNMIIGNAKRLYSEQGIDFDLTLPSMLVGQSKPLHHSVQGPPILLPFSTDAGEFYLELCFK